MNWKRGLAGAFFIVGGAVAVTVVVIGMILAIGGWALIPILALLFIAIMVGEALR